MKYSANDIKELRDKTGAGLIDCKNALVETGDLKKAILLLKEKGVIHAEKKNTRQTDQGIIHIGYSEDKKSAVILKLSCETDFVARTEEFQKVADQITSFLIKENEKNNSSNCIELDLSKDIQNITQEAVQRLGENIKVQQAYLMKVCQIGEVLKSYIHPGNQTGVLSMFELNNISHAENQEVTDLFKDVNMQIVAMSPKYLSKDFVPSEVIEEQKMIFQKQLKETKKPKEILEKIVDGKINQFYKEITLLDQIYIKDSKKNLENHIHDISKKLSENIKVKNFIRMNI